ncbi:hypothetical protein M3Y98_00842000 [Aphelenchoides besseyi]|nr:hypothetical protein M3Y98_00842000 [Aphelenchoides besseyi]
MIDWRHQAKSSCDDAECIPRRKFYAYFGPRNVSLDGRSCARWSEVRAGMEDFFFPTEYETHSQCRTVLLDQYERNSDINNASAHSFIDTEGWKNGPWCYVKVPESKSRTSLWFGRFTSNYEPFRCFEFCADQIDPTTSVPESTSHPSSEVPFRYTYQVGLLDHLTDRFFNSFELDDVSYYTSKHFSKLSIGFEIRRHYIFFLLVTLLFLGIGVMVGSWLWRKFRSNKKEEPMMETAIELSETAVEFPVEMIVNNPQPIQSADEIRTLTNRSADQAPVPTLLPDVNQNRKSMK